MLSAVADIDDERNKKERHESRGCKEEFCDYLERYAGRGKLKENTHERPECDTCGDGRKRLVAGVLPVMEQDEHAKGEIDRSDQYLDKYPDVDVEYRQHGLGGWR